MAKAVAIAFAGTHCSLEIWRPDVGVVVAIFDGCDIGEFGEAPFRELDADLATGEPLELFIDARKAIGPSIEVSGGWAQWMMAHRAQLHRVHIVCTTRLVEISAHFVQRFTQFGPRMRIYSNETDFDEAVRVASGLKRTAEISAPDESSGPVWS